MEDNTAHTPHIRELNPEIEARVKKRGLRFFRLTS